MKPLVLVVAAVCAVAAPVWGQTVASNNNVDARRHFQEGLENAQRGDLPKALTEFEAAYAAQPNFTVLYNIGQARSALGQPVQAVTAFERYLAEGGEQVTASRREEVLAIIATNRRRIGLLQIVTDATAHARVWVDGSEVLGDQLAAPLQLAEGAHSILYVEGGCLPVSRTQTVLGGQTVDLELGRSTDCAKPLGQLAIDCEVPEVEVVVVGVTKARTPLDAPLLVPAGDVLVQFRRPGYAEVARRVRLGPRAMSRVACGLRVLEPLPPNIAAQLVVQKSPEDARVLVDGQPFHGGLLPAGAHQVGVALDGFVPTQRLVFLEPTKTASFSVALAKTAERQARDKASASRRKHWGIALGGAGVAFLGSAAGLYAWNSQRYTDWRDTAANSSGRADLKLATSVQRVDDLSIAFMVLGVGLTGAGAWLLFAPE